MSHPTQTVSANGMAEMVRDCISGLQKIKLTEPKGSSSEETRKRSSALAYFCFELRLRVTLGSGTLHLTSRVRNTDRKPFTFTIALHTHLSVADISTFANAQVLFKLLSEVRVEGLETLDYFDNLLNQERFTEQGDSITFDSEVDRVYLSTPTNLAVIDHEKKRTIVLRKGGLADAAVWNPWEKKCKSMPDLGDEDYMRMLCIEAAAVEKPISLKPGEEWTGRQELEVVSSSYFSGQMDPVQVQDKS